MHIIKIKDANGQWVDIPAIVGPQGATFTPSVNAEGVLSWTNDGGLTNPQSVNIKGPQGEPGQPGTSVAVHICSSSEYNLSGVPTIANPDVNTFYLVPTGNQAGGDMFTEWVYVDGEWELFGSSRVDLSNYVQKTDYATNSYAGIVKIGAGLGMDGSFLTLYKASNNQIKQGTASYSPIVPSNQERSTFYGLAKAAGDTTQSQSSNAVGTYTDEAKAAIKSMIGVNVEDVQVNGTSVVSNGVANIPIADDSNPGVVKVPGDRGLAMTTAGNITLVPAASSLIKAGEQNYFPITPKKQHEAVFYGLAKAAGDTTQAASDAVGAYTDEAKAAIKSMIGVNVDDVQVNGVSVLQDGVANVPRATMSSVGVVKPHGSYGVGMWESDSSLRIDRAPDDNVKTGSESYKPIVPSTQHASAFYGLAKAAGDTTQSASSNAVGTYTDNAKSAIKAMIGVQDGSTGTVDVAGTTPTIAAAENTRYVCGEVTSLSFTPPSSGIAIVRFTSGSTVTVLTIPSTVKFPEWFDPTSLETDTIYEICVTDGVYGAVMSWAL